LSADDKVMMVTLERDLAKLTNITPSNKRLQT